MNAWDVLNQWGEAWAGVITARSLDVLALFFLLGLVWLLLHKRLTPQVSYWLFVLVLLKAVIPWEIQAPSWMKYVSYQPIVHNVQTWTGATRYPMYNREPAPPSPPADPSPAALSSASAAESPRSEPKVTSTQTLRDAPPVNASTVFFLLWSCIAAFFLIRLTAMEWRMHQWVKQGTQLDLKLLPIEVDELKKRLGVKKTISIVASESIRLPIVWGRFHPCLLVPVDFFEVYTKPQLNWIVSHELAHIRRGDSFVAALQRAVQILYFFHPAVWIANRLIDVHREYACDDMALLASRSPRLDCGQGFLSLALKGSRTPIPAAGLTGLFHSNTQIRRRMMRILDEKRKLNARISFGMISVLLVVACTENVNNLETTPNRI